MSEIKKGPTSVINKEKAGSSCLLCLFLWCFMVARTLRQSKLWMGFTSSEKHGRGERGWRGLREGRAYLHFAATLRIRVDSNLWEGSVHI